MKIIRILIVVLNLGLGGLLILGSTKKFGEMPAPTELYSKINDKKELLQNTEKLQLQNYFFGLKQSYFWKFLGICELVAGILLVSQVFSLLGATISLPIYLNIFLVHLLMESDETLEIIQTGSYVMANAVIIAYFYPKWKHLLWLKPWNAQN